VLQYVGIALMVIGATLRKLAKIERQDYEDPSDIDLD